MAEIDPRPRRATGVMLIGTVFLIGMVCGAALFYLGQASVGGRGGERGRPFAPTPGSGDPMMRMFEELDLSAEQAAEIREILRGSRGEVRQLIEQSREEIRGLLDEEQRDAFDRLGPGMRGPRGRRPPGPRDRDRPRRPRPPPPGADG